MNKGLGKVMLLLGLVPAFLWSPAIGATIRVPAEVSNLQKAMDAADNGDLILVAPGTYRTNLKFPGEAKKVTLASHFFLTGDRKDIDRTILKAGWVRTAGLRFRRPYVIEVPADAHPGSKIMGFTIKNGNDGIKCLGRVDILNNTVVNCKDGIDYEDGSGGLCKSNTLRENKDDGIDLDGAVDVVIENNVVANNGDDGIEIRLEPYQGPTVPLLRIIIRQNVISGNKEDGLQFIDYGTHSKRMIQVERNLFHKNVMAAIGSMGRMNTVENYEAFRLPERVNIINNTFIENGYGLLGGNNMVVINNIFMGTKNVALKNITGHSATVNNLFWMNGADAQNAAVALEQNYRMDPKLTPDHRLQSTSPCIDQGMPFFPFRDEVITIPPNSFKGPKPDLGAYEVQGRQGL